MTGDEVRPDMTVGEFAELFPVGVPTSFTYQGRRYNVLRMTSGTDADGLTAAQRAQLDELEHPSQPDVGEPVSADCEGEQDEPGEEWWRDYDDSDD